MNPNVLIVGAGPVGLTMAIELARYGVGVRIIDKAPTRTDKSKAVAVWSRSLELLERAGLASALVDAGVRVKAANITNGAERIARVRLDDVDTPYPFALMIPQSETERILETRLSALGVTIERCVELKSFMDGPSGIDAVVECQDGSTEEISADWLVGCDGAHSQVRHSLGIEFRGDTVAAEFVLADIRLSGAPPPDELLICWHRDGIVIFFPLPDNRTRVVASMDASADAIAPDPTLPEVQAIIDERGPGGLLASDPVWMARFRVNERKVDAFRSGRVFLAGDAAHIHSPAGGQGMNTGMQDAVNLAWKLALVCRGGCVSSLLDSYSIEREPVAADVIASTGRLTRIAMLRNPLAQAARNFVAKQILGLQSIQHAAGETLAELSVGYDDSPLNGEHAAGLRGPSPGHRFPPPAGERAIGAGDRPRFAVFAAGADNRAATVRETYSDLLEEQVRAPIDPSGIWLVRPDGYVAMTARAADWQAVEDYLASLKGRAGSLAHSRASRK
jgi:2-polyprenyl-6-methoxyphenol hydroxylase-like FAD-dependent oxidoreductase